MKKYNLTDPVTIFDNGWGTMPNTVLFDKSVSSTAKLLYCYISSLCASTGICWATNAHFAEKFGISRRQVIRLIEEIDNYVVVGQNDKGKRGIKCFRLSDRGDKNVTGGVTKMSSLTDTNNIIIEKSMSETQKEQILALHKGYIKRFILDQDKLPYLTDSEREKELESALKQKYRLTPKRKATALARLKDAGYDMCKQAIINANKDPWNHGENKSGWKLDLYDYLFRNYEQVEKWANR